jgi:hypothetical protein
MTQKILAAVAVGERQTEIQEYDTPKIQAKQRVYDGFKQLKKNRTTIDAAINYSYAQGMISRRLEIEELFAKTTLDEFVI